MCNAKYCVFWHSIRENHNIFGISKYVSVSIYLSAFQIRLTEMFLFDGPQQAIKEPRFRRLQAHYETSLLAHLIPDLSFDPLSNSSLLQTLGRRRETISRFMREDVNKRDVFILLTVTD